MKNQNTTFLPYSQKNEKMKKILFMFEQNAYDGGTIRRARTYNSHCWLQLQVKRRAERAFKRPLL